MKYALMVVGALVLGIGAGFWFAERTVVPLAPATSPVPTASGTPSAASTEEAGSPAAPGMPEESAKTEPQRGSVVVYEEVSVAASSRVLDLSGRGYTGSLKAEVRLLQDLEVLNLSGNAFTGLPAEVGQLTKLRVLNPSNNQFTGLPLELGNLQNLEVLDLRGNQNIATVDLEQIRARLPVGVSVLR